MASNASEILMKLGKLFKSRCALCLGKMKTSKGFTLHHFDYEGELGQVTYKIYKKKYGNAYKNPYYCDLEPLVYKYKSHFVLVHNSCHQAIERVKRWSKPNRKRLFRLAEKTK